MSATRRVIAGIDGQGRSAFLRDEEVPAQQPPVFGGVKITMLFGQDEPRTVPGRGERPEGMRFFPLAPEAYRFMICSVPPLSEILPMPEDEVAAQAAVEESERVTPGILDLGPLVFRPHFTPTVDIVYVLSGELTLTLDDGASTLLRPGDSCLLDGARHAWSNAGEAWGTFLCGVLGAELDASRHAPEPEEA